MTLDLVRARDRKGPFDVFLPILSSPSLGLGGPDPTEQWAGDPKPTHPPYLFREDCRLVEASLSLPLGMKRNRNQQVILSMIK